MADEIGRHPSNAKGHWERREIVEFHDRILEHLNRGFYTPGHDLAMPVAWWADPQVSEVRRDIVAFLSGRVSGVPFGFKDPRTVRLLPIWHQIFGELDLEPKLIFCMRNPAQVARSLHARDGLDDGFGELRWFTYIVDFFRYTRNSDICILEYENWFDDPAANLEKLCSFIEPAGLHRTLDADSLIAAIADDALRHDDRQHSRARLPLVRALYALARRADRDTAAREQVLAVAAQYAGFNQLQSALQRAFERNTELALRVPALEERAASLRAALEQSETALAVASRRAEDSTARAKESAARERTAWLELDRQVARQKIAAQLAAAEAVHAEVTRLRAASAAAEAETRARRDELERAKRELAELSVGLAEAERRADGIRAAAQDEVARLREANATTTAQLDQAARELGAVREALAGAERLANEIRTSAERDLADATASIAELENRLGERTVQAEKALSHESAARAELDRQRALIGGSTRQRNAAPLGAAAAQDGPSSRRHEAAAETASDALRRAGERDEPATGMGVPPAARLAEPTRSAAQTEAALQIKVEKLRAELVAAKAAIADRPSLVRRIMRTGRSQVGAAIRAGDQASRSGDVAAAVRHYRRALERSPGLTAIWVQLGHALKEQGDYREAEAAYRRSLALDDSVADTHLQLGHLLKLSSRWAEAAEAYASALQLDPAAHDVAHELDSLTPRLLEEGDRSRGAGNWLAAALHYRCALRHEPGLTAIWVQLGHALREQGDCVGAESAYRRSLSLDPSIADTHLQLGRSLKGQARWGEAAEAYARALQLDPDLKQAAEELAVLSPRLAEEGDKAGEARAWPAAVWYYRRALDCQPANAAVLGRLGRALQEQGDYLAAEAAYRDALAHDDALADIHLQLGHLLTLRGRYSQAIDAYAGAVRLAPDLTEARERLHVLLASPPSAPALPIAADGADVPATGRGHDVIWLGVIDWHYRIQRPQHLATHLADLGARVFYVSLVFEPPDPSGRFRIIESPHRGVFEIRMRFPGNDAENLYRGLSREAVRELQTSLDEMIAVLGIATPVVVVEHPAWQQIACGVPGATVVYDCLDLATGFSTADESTHSFEAAMLATADLVVVASQPLADHVAQLRSSFLVRNAAEVELFAQGFTERQAGERPIIGYFGAIAEWFDIELVEQCAAARPDWEFRLVGRTDGCDVSRAVQLPNVHFLGEMPYRELPLFLREVDVAIIPFRMIDLIQCTNPVKLYEYMAAGKPVVAVPMPEVVEATALAYIAHDAGSFVDRIAQALAEDSMALRLRRLAWARQHTWVSRAHQLKQAIDASLPLVSVIVLTYNNWDYTSACLAALCRHSDYPNLEIIVVDNASTDQTRDNLHRLALQDSRFRIVFNDTNLGFAGGNNVGLRLARGDFMVLLNNDTIVTRGWVRDLIRPMQLDPAIGLTGPLTNAIGNEQKVKRAYDSVDEMPAWARRFVRGRLRRTFEAGNLAFFCVAIRRSVLEEVGLLDDVYGLGFFEDDDYSRRAKRANYKLIIVDDVFVHHHLSASYSALGSAASDELMARNKAIFEQRWGVWEPHRYRDEPAFG
jgi:GT2 family glycosyltransferase/tetratricopeptide (TPR) repeat protein